jgi:hypothetical protein
MENVQSNNDVNIIPEYTLIKRVILQQYYNAQVLLTTYDMKPKITNEKKCRESLILLSRSIQFKSYVLSSDYAKVFNSFISSPHRFEKFNLHLIFSICSLILEILGLTKVETENISKENVFQEV